MIASGPSAKRSKNMRGTARPNLIPIMNLFLVIIPMLITMITATGMQMIAINIPTSGGGGDSGAQAQEEQEKKASIFLAILPDKFQIRVDDEIFKEIPLTADDNYDYVALNKVIDELDKLHPNVEKVKLFPSNNVYFDSFIKAMDVCKKGGRFPNIGYGFSMKTYIRN